MATFSLTVTSGDVPGTLTNYPAYIDLAQMPAAFWSAVSANAQTHSLDLETSSSQYASIADASQTGLDLSGDNTIEFWVKPESLPGSGAVWGLITKDDLASQRSYAVDLYNNAGSQKIRMFMSSNAAGSNYVEVTFTQTLPTGVWTHVVITTTIANAAATRSTLYIDSESKGNGSGATGGTGASSIVNTTSAFTIGRYGASASTFDGLIKNVRVFSDVRTAAEIRSDMKTQHITDANLVGEWYFNNAYTDSSGNGNTLTATNSPTFATDVPFTNAGRDIRIYSDSGLTTELAREVVACDTSGETGEVHTKIPSLTSSTVIYLDVDGTRNEPASNSTYGSEAVWSDYARVYHMQQGTGARWNSAGGLNLTGTNRGAVTGFLTNSNDFEESSADFLTSENTGLVNVTNLSIEICFRAESFTDTYPILAAVFDDNTDSRAWALAFISSNLYFYVSDNGANSGLDQLASAALSTATNYYTTHTFEGLGTSNFNTYINTVNYNKTSTVANSVANEATAFQVGHAVTFAGAAATSYWDGTIDELRIRTDVILSANWDTTKYHNQSDVAGFWTIAEVGGGGGTFIPRASFFM